MGYDALRFIGKVDEEFHCCICSMVLENPVQAPCEHNFCSHCITEWVTVNQICPVDREPLSQSHLKPLNRSFRNLWNKLQLKCDFQSEGCEEVVKLEQLQGHVTKCEYRTVTCDKGCNLKMIRREYQANNCFAHFDEHVRKLGDQLSTEMILVLTNQRAYSKFIVESHRKENRKLIEENEKLKLQLRKSVNFTSHAPPIKSFRTSNINIDTDSSNILEHGSTDQKAMAQQLSILTPRNNSFKVEILAGSEINIGLACKGETFENKSLPSVAYLWLNASPSSRLPLIVDGEIVECGIKYPPNFIQSKENNVRVYFVVNGQFIYETKTKMPKDGLFPTICFENNEGNISKSKVKFL